MAIFKPDKQPSVQSRRTDRLPPETTSSAKSGEKDTPTAEDQQQSNSNEGAEPESPEAQDRAERSSSDGASPGKDSEEEEVKSKQSASSEEARSKDRVTPQMSCSRTLLLGEDGWTVGPFPVWWPV